MSTILETRETQRGLIVNINDVLFDFNKYTLKPGAREKLAKMAGILLAYPGLKIQLEGHTDAIGSDGYNLESCKFRTRLPGLAKRSTGYRDGRRLRQS